MISGSIVVLVKWNVIIVVLKIISLWLCVNMVNCDGCGCGLLGVWFILCVKLWLIVFGGICSVVSMLINVMLVSI